MTPRNALQTLRAATWKNRYAARMAAMLGSWYGCYESADEAWVDCGGERSPEEAAENEVAEWRRLMSEDSE